MNNNIYQNQQDRFLEVTILELLQDIKLVQGGTALASTLRRHPQIKKYLIEKQVQRLSQIEQDNFPQ